MLILHVFTQKNNDVVRYCFYEKADLRPPAGYIGFGIGLKNAISI